MPLWISRLLVFFSSALRYSILFCATSISRAAISPLARATSSFAQSLASCGSLHSTVSNSNTGVIDDYLQALRACVDEVAGTTTDDRSTNYATLE